MTTNRSMTVTEQAAQWYVDLDESSRDADIRRLFCDWLKQSPKHIEEFLAIAELERAVAAQPSSIEDLLAEIREISGEKAVPFAGNPDSARHPARKAAASRRRRPIAWAAVAGLAALAAILVTRMPDSEVPAVTHKTELGEQRSIALGDGSIVMLNTLSEARVRFDDEERRVTLVTGEAMFEVVPDTARPFIVETGNLSVRVVGTKFAVYRKGGSTRVAVVEGVVSAARHRHPGEKVELRKGQGAIFDGDREVQRDAAFNLERAVAWTERRLIFENARLADVVSEFNRYNRTQLVVDEGELADREITTVVNAHDVSALLGFLQLQPDVRVEYGAEAIRISAATDVR